MIELFGPYITKPKRKMKHKLQVYKGIIEDLHKQVELCKLYKEKVRDAIQRLGIQYKSGAIKKEIYLSQLNKFLQNKSPQEWYYTYDNHINICYNKIREYNEKIEQLSHEKQVNINSKTKLFMFIGIISMLIAAMFTIEPSIIGFASLTIKSATISEDGFTKEGTDWQEIHGSKVYERCIKVNSQQNFDSVEITAKITNAIDNKDLIFKLYNDSYDEPSDLIGLCNVKEYDSIWKSCTIKDLEQNSGEYWICASNPNGNSDVIYYTIAYQVGDEKQTALWTGNYWQKLNRASYTIKAKFIEHE